MPRKSRASGAGESTHKRRKKTLTLTGRKYSHKNKIIVDVPAEVPSQAEWDQMEPLEGFISVDDDDPDDSDASEHADAHADKDGTKSVQTVKRLMFFRKGGDAILHSDKDETHDVWLGRIAQIRQRANGEVWVKTLWYFSGSDAEAHMKSFDAKKCAPFERVVSDNFDILRDACFVASTYLFEYDEADLNPPDLTPNDFFARVRMQFEKFTFEHMARCCCAKSYVPFLTPDSESAPSRLQKSPHDPEVMHFCPRPSCREWYHATCLVVRGFVDADHAPYHGDRGLRLLGVDPDEDHLSSLFVWFCEEIKSEETELEMTTEPEMTSESETLINGSIPELTASMSTAHNNAHRRSPSSASSSSSSSSASTDSACTPPPFADPPTTMFLPGPSDSPTTLHPPTSRSPLSPLSPLPISHLHTSLEEALDSWNMPAILAHLPPALVRIAQCPIVRRPGPPAGGWSAVGNVREVVLARRLVYAALHGVRPGAPGEAALVARAQALEALAEENRITALVLAVVEDADKEGGGYAGAALDAREAEHVEGLMALGDDMQRLGLLASPYVPYWERRARELDDENWMDAPPVTCPRCGGPI